VPTPFSTLYPTEYFWTSRLWPLFTRDSVLTVENCILWTEAPSRPDICDVMSSLNLFFSFSPLCRDQGLLSEHGMTFYDSLPAHQNYQVTPSRLKRWSARGRLADFFLPLRKGQRYILLLSFCRKMDAVHSKIFKQSSPTIFPRFPSPVASPESGLEGFPRLVTQNVLNTLGTDVGTPVESRRLETVNSQIIRIKYPPPLLPLCALEIPQVAGELLVMGLSDPCFFFQYLVLPFSTLWRPLELCFCVEGIGPFPAKFSPVSYVSLSMPCVDVSSFP